jgi:outer membrane protein OmpA-like peptidoglycan-associated protein
VGIARTCFISLALLVFASTAHAQPTGYAVNRFEPAERGSMWFALDSLDMRRAIRPAFGITGDWQYRALTIDKPVLEQVITTHVGTSLVIGDTMRLGVNLPLVTYQTGSRGQHDGLTYDPPPDAQALGDVRLGFDLRLFGDNRTPLAMALGGNVWIPSGDRKRYTSDGNFRGAPHLLVAGVIDWFTFAVKTGVEFRRPRDSGGDFGGAPIGHELFAALAVGARAAKGRFVAGPELMGRTVLTHATMETLTTPVEIIFGLHYAFIGGFRIGAASGLGLTSGYGAPDARTLLSMEFTPDIVEDRDGDGIEDDEDACPDTKGVRSADPEKNGCPPEKPPPPKDRDKDGIIDADDACPDVPGVKSDDPKKNGCPPDKDGDGIPDVDDACPDVPGVKSDDPKKNGCPPDRDGDGVLDPDDACPDVPGIKTNDPKTNGCPDPDRDKDGIPNDQDACPDEPGKPDPDPKRNGCPKAFVQGGQIKIVDQVKFKVNSAEIQKTKDSEEVLDAVLKVLNDHPEIKKVRVEGHTDNRGGPELNRKLSAARAASVVAWLVAHGVDVGRLRSQGFGPDRPIDSNATDEGRQNNRRVEFHIEDPPPPAP